MPVEIKGQQLRIRLLSPRRFEKFRIHDVGEKGRLQRVAGYSKKLGWATQAWRLNLKDYKSFSEVHDEIVSLNLPRKKEEKALRLAWEYFWR